MMEPGEKVAEKEEESRAEIKTNHRKLEIEPSVPNVKENSKAIFLKEEQVEAGKVPEKKEKSIPFIL